MKSDLSSKFMIQNITCQQFYYDSEILLGFLGCSLSSVIQDLRRKMKRGSEVLNENIVLRRVEKQSNMGTNNLVNDKSKHWLIVTPLPYIPIKSV